jgi:diaminopimelate decarboxylase
MNSGNQNVEGLELQIKTQEVEIASLLKTVETMRKQLVRITNAHFDPL